MRLLSAFAAIPLFLNGCAWAATSCYYPDGTFAQDDSPCFPDQPQSICCGQGHTCMSNNLCRWPASEMSFPLAYIRGSCTDSSWNSSSCGNVCKTVFPSEYDPIIACPGAEFCCELDGNNPLGCCNLTNTTAHPLYTLDAASTVTVIGVTSSSYAAPTSTPSTISTTASVVTTTTTTSPVSQISGNSNVTNGNVGSKIGIGVGVGGGVLVLAGLLFGFFFWRRKRVTGDHAAMDTAPAMPAYEIGGAEPQYKDKKDTVIPVHYSQEKGYAPVPVYYSELDGNSRGQELSG